MLIDILLGGNSFGDKLLLLLVALISSAIIVFLTLPIHEFAHGLVAHWLGDNTAKNMGRLTLNPLKHLDIIGSLSILIFGFGWAKPVPVNMNRFKNPKVGMAITALAGPVSNLILAFIATFFTVLIRFIIQLGEMSFIVSFIYTVCYYIATINVSLAVFNLIPIPPLDGSRILNAFLSDRVYYKIMAYENYFFILILVVINAFSGVITAVDNAFLDLFVNIWVSFFSLFI